MKDKRKALEIIAEKLKDIPWAIFSGTAVEIYTKGKRIGNDIDIIVPPDMIDEAARRFGAKPIFESREKGRIKVVNDYHVETEVDGIPVEFVGKTEKFIIDGKEYDPSYGFFKTDLSKRIKKMNYQGITVSVVPIEEILVQKILFNRSGRWQDENDIKLLLENYQIEKDSLVLAFKVWGIPENQQEEIIKKLNSF